MVLFFSWENGSEQRFSAGIGRFRRSRARHGVFKVQKSHFGSFTILLTLNKILDGHFPPNHLLLSLSIFLSLLFTRRPPAVAVASVGFAVDSFGARGASWGDSGATGSPLSSSSSSLSSSSSSSSSIMPIEAKFRRGGEDLGFGFWRRDRSSRRGGTLGNHNLPPDRIGGEGRVADIVFGFFWFSSFLHYSSDISSLLQFHRSNLRSFSETIDPPIYFPKRLLGRF